MPTASTTRIETRFRELRERQAKGLVVYFTAGDPSLEATGDLLAALDRAGVDVIELGVPFSDPLADGPVIQRASERALRAGTTLRRILERFPRWRESVQAPIILFSYYNPILQYGLEKFARDAAQAGVDGALAVDLSPEEASPYVSVLRARNLDTVFLASPTSTDARLEQASKLSTGFLYLVSRTGVTGERSEISVERPAAGGAGSAAHFAALGGGFRHFQSCPGTRGAVGCGCGGGRQRGSACHRRAVRRRRGGGD